MLGLETQELHPGFTVYCFCCQSQAKRNKKSLGWNRIAEQEVKGENERKKRLSGETVILDESLGIKQPWCLYILS